MDLFFADTNIGKIYHKSHLNNCKFLEISQKYTQKSKYRTKCLHFKKKKTNFVRDLWKMRRMLKIPKFVNVNP